MTKTRFLDKTLLAAARIARQAFLSELYAGRPGVLQALDVRVKLLSLATILVGVSFLHSAGTLFFLCLLAVGLAYGSQVPPGFFLRRVWLVVPLFSGLIVLPALLNIVTPGQPVLVLASLSHSRTWGPYAIPAEITITREGMQFAIVFLLRIGASLSFAMLFTLTTRWSRIFEGLRMLFVPRIFVVTLAMTERYLFVLVKLIEDMYRARKSRTMRPLPPSLERSWIASRMGVTFRKSMDMSEEIYQAMLSRGFQGEFRTLNRLHLTAADAIWIAGALFIGSLLFFIERGWIHS